jgi:hypothetical protein
LQVRNPHLKQKDRDLEIAGQENLDHDQRNEDRAEKDILLHHPKHLHSVMQVERGTAAEGKEEILMYLVPPKKFEKDQDHERPIH